MQNNKALICALYVLINSQYPSNMHANKELNLLFDQTVSLEVHSGRSEHLYEGHRDRE